MVDAFLKLNKGYQLAIADVTKRMGEGMAEFIAKEARIAACALRCVGGADSAAPQVVTLKDYNRYCYYVAGLVGVGLSRLFTAAGACGSGAPHAMRGAPESCAARSGGRRVCA